MNIWGEPMASVDVIRRVQRLPAEIELLRTCCVVDIQLPHAGHGIYQNLKLEKVFCCC